MLKISSKPLIFLLVFMFLSFGLGWMGTISGEMPKEVKMHFEEMELPYFPWFLILIQIISWTIIFCFPAYFLVSAFWPDLPLAEKIILILIWGSFVASLSPSLLIPTIGMKNFTEYQYAFDLLFSFLVFIIGFCIWIFKKSKA